MALHVRKNDSVMVILPHLELLGSLRFDSKTLLGHSLSPAI